ncbi:MAG: guanine deaminase [Alphaproteobacteria bacterium]|nr:guanine deaminase [Alphaproteobacteria bacterium]
MIFPSLVIQGTAFHTPERGRIDVIENGAIAVAPDGTIETVLHPEAGEYQALIDAAGSRGVLMRLDPESYLIPGLIDLHIHAPQWPQLGKALDAPLEEWLQTYTFPLEAKFADLEFARVVYDDLVRTLLAHGTTTAVYFGSVDFQANVILAQTCLRHGQRALVGKVAMDHVDQCPDYYRDESAVSALEETRRFIETVRQMKQGDHPLVRPAITPRFIPSCTDTLLQSLGALAAQTGCHVQTHCSESDWEVAHVRERLGQTDAEALDGFGLLTDRTILAHSNYITGSDMRLLANRGSAVAHCPLSNAYFANAVFPVRDALDKGVDVGLGTDISGGFSPSIFDAVRCALVASRHACSGTDPLLTPDDRGTASEPLSAADSFWLATAGGGRSLSSPIGLFRSGYHFDALCIRSNSPQSAFRVNASLDSPVDVFEKLVLTSDRSCIEHVWVDGKRRVLEGEVVAKP